MSLHFLEIKEQRDRNFIGQNQRELVSPIDTIKEEKRMYYRL